MASMYAPVSANDARRIAQRRATAQSACNTLLLCVCAICLAVILGGGGGGGGDDGGAPPSLGPGAMAVPGLPNILFTDPATGTDGEWEAMGGGPLPIYLHTPTGRAWADVAGSLEQDLLLVEQVTQGVGVRGTWDAGSVISQRLVNLKRVGPKILLVALEYAHRASDPEVQASVEQSFANSVMWTFAAQDKTAQGAGLYIDLTDWVLRDTDGSPETQGFRTLAGLSEVLNRRGGDWHVNVARSLINTDKLKSRPQFSCVETNLTYVDDTASATGLSKSLPDPTSITIALRRSFVQLPPLEGPTAFEPRPFIPKSSYYQVAFTDEAAPLLGQRIQTFTRRHPIGGVTPGRPLQAGGAGIKYYLDNGCPSYLSGAIIEGINFWDQAFQSAGYPVGTFNAELQPADVDLFDIDRTFNAVQWVHRDHRSWSVGQQIFDPRTGEILKGHVHLGSLRSRQDTLIGLGLIQPYRHAEEGSRRAGELFAEVESAVLQRHRQLGAETPFVRHFALYKPNVSREARDKHWKT
jgi:hypothetical protein